MFAPDDSCTRAQIVTFLYRHAKSPEVSGEYGFTDACDECYEDAIIWATEKGIAQGYGDGTFGPNDTCTRAQAVTFLYRYLGGEKAQGSVKGFDDVDSTSCYYEAIMWAAENGIAQGYGDGKFGPDDLCTRAQIVTLIYRAVK